jgi:hypothetical protein
VECKGSYLHNECTDCGNLKSIYQYGKIKECKQPKICAKGYYLPDDDLTYEDCQQCSIKGCIKCNGTYENNECTDCGNLKSIYKNGKIIECKEPITCNEGYYLPDDDLTYEDCKKCSVKGCRKCSGTYENNECIFCSFYSNSIYENFKIVDCKCYEGYYVPDDDINCKKCSIKNCKKCNGTKNYDECTDCGNLKSIVRPIKIFIKCFLQSNN